ncbi:response regulator transcription factor [Burkholderia territorii]|uniref:response regulator transcription factor n=1 Tax=Burkholderia territorii TaxID=1503055 RepID=UPI0012D8E8D0|nr:response regulator transcription factor [Burkholderia territorii]
MATLLDVDRSCHFFVDDGAFRELKIKDRDFNLMIVDCDTVDLACEIVGWAISEGFREKGPVICILPDGNEFDVERIFGVGADDCIFSDVSAEFLLTRIRAVTRRVDCISQIPLCRVFGGYVFDGRMNAVVTGGIKVSLTRKEFDLAILLFENLCRPVSRECLVELVWRGVVCKNSRTIDAHISSVRRKLKLVPENGYRLTAIYSYGYMLDHLGGAVL